MPPLPSHFFPVTPQELADLTTLRPVYRIANTIFYAIPPPGFYGDDSSHNVTADDPSAEATADDQQPLPEPQADPVPHPPAPAGQLDIDEPSVDERQSAAEHVDIEGPTNDDPPRTFQPYPKDPKNHRTVSKIKGLSKAEKETAYVRL